MSYEDILKTTILPELEVGRPNWDKPHTEAVAEHIKAIMDNSPALNLDKEVLIIAAYAHDWGYAGLFEGGKPLEIDDVDKAKEAHMAIGADKLTELLKDKAFDFLTKDQKQRAIHLVKTHDKLDTLTEPDELVLMEADTLGGLDIEKVKPSFNRASNEKYMRGVKAKRYPLFITDYGKVQFERLYKSREDYYTNQ